MHINKIKKCLFLAAIISFSNAEACLMTPIPGTTITSNFGLRFHPVYHTWKPHRGTDMRAAMYTPIVSAHTGTIIFSGWMGGGGNTIKIQGDDGIQTDYLHLSKAGINVGDKVQAGQRIALSGNTGHASAAPHLHFQTHTNNGVTLVDPKSLLCNALPEKPGAGPDRAAPNGYPSPAVSTTGNSPTSTPVGGGSAIHASHSTLASYEGMSELDIMKTETEKRFLNPEWHLRINNCDTDFLKQEIDGNPAVLKDCKVSIYKEIVSMSLFSNWIKSQKSESMQRIESMLAVKQAMAARQASQKRMNSVKSTLRSR